MSMILCPECGAKISDKATVCPHCGFIGADSSLPICTQDKYEVVPMFDFEMEEWNPEHKDCSVISYDDNKTLISYFGQWKNIKNTLPAIAETIKAMATQEKVLVAEMDAYIKKLIEAGVYKFSIDKAGEILPTIRDSSRIVKQVRLREMSLSPQLTQSLNNLTTQAMMTQILDEIQYVGDAIKGIHIELQNDRLAQAESARDKLLQAQRIQDSSLRQIAILNVLASATDAKRILMKNLSQNIQYITEHSDKSFAQLLFDFKGQRDIDVKASDSLTALVAITNAVQIECYGYSMIGELEAAKECLSQFKQFIEDNKLGERDTLLQINGNVEVKQISVVEQFSTIAERITSFDKTKQIDYNITGLLAGGEDDE